MQFSIAKILLAVLCLGCFLSTVTAGSDMSCQMSLSAPFHHGMRSPSTKSETNPTTTSKPETRPDQHQMFYGTMG
uniref:Putative secreted mucin n=1 Tax=Psorophora albipes TaxID=869069 RepID=T1DJC4_9DIPT